MRFWLTLLGVIALLIVLGHLLSVAVGLLFWFGAIALIVSIAGALIRNGMVERQLTSAPGRREQRRIDRTADRKLKEIERRVNKP